MRKILSFFLIIGLFSIFQACSTVEDSEVEISLNDDMLEDKKVDSKCGGKIFDNVVLKNGILEFISMDHFRQVLECLEYQLEQHQLSFELANASLTDEELEDLEEKTGFSDWQPLEDFENSLGFYSRRKHIEDKIVLWLDNPTFDVASDPDELDDLSEELRTLLNLDGKVRIGKDVYDYLDETIEKIPDCRRFAKEVTYCEYDNKSKRFKLKAAVRSYPWKMKAKAKVVSYRKRNSGNGWRRHRTRLVIQVAGSARSAGCTWPLAVGDYNGPRRRRSLKAKHVYWFPPTWVKFAPGEVIGYCVVSDQQVDKTLFIDW